MSTQELLKQARDHLQLLKGDVFDVLTVSKPTSIGQAHNLAKIISKLSPLVGNLIEYKTVEYLNSNCKCECEGVWKRQDPGFPDVIFDGALLPAPGFEIKAWFPFATEITGRFKDSEERFHNDEIDLVILAWLPEYVVWGKPKIIDVCVVSGKSVALARDKHYHNPPHYLVIEPEDTTGRTSNLQQTNTNGYVIQPNSQSDLSVAQKIVNGWGATGLSYSTSKSYQNKLKSLMAAVKYRLDTNYAKIDRIEHDGIEAFKQRVMDSVIAGKQVGAWKRIINDLPEDVSKSILA